MRKFEIAARVALIIAGVMLAVLIVNAASRAEGPVEPISSSTSEPAPSATWILGEPVGVEVTDTPSAPGPAETGGGLGIPDRTPTQRLLASFSAIALLWLGIALYARRCPGRSPLKPWHCWHYDAVANPVTVTVQSHGPRLANPPSVTRDRYQCCYCPAERLEDRSW